MNETWNLHVSMNEISVSRPPDRSFDSHQTMFFCPLENSVGFEDFAAGVFVIRLNPTNVFAASKAPTLQAQPTQVQSVGRSAPVEQKFSFLFVYLFSVENLFQFTQCVPKN